MVMGGEYSFIVSGLDRWVTDKLKRSGKSGKQKGRMEEKQEIIRRIIKSRKELFDCMLLF